MTGDILGNLYERFLDVKSRKKLGEFYTPLPLANYVLHRIGFYDSPGPLLDPACGSGTFLIAAVTGLIQRLRARGVSAQEAVEQAVNLVHGLDINVFAAFIAQLQLIWHLLPYLKEAHIPIPDLNIYGGVNSLVYDSQTTLSGAVLEGMSDRAEAIRDGEYKYVVGNPPFIRNERFKDWGNWRGFYRRVDHHNSDVAFFFVKRTIDGGRFEEKGQPPSTMPSWLKNEGKMCWVLPMGVCDSRAAQPLRDCLMDYSILEITDLEDVAGLAFPSPQASGRGTVIPVLIFAQKAPPDSVQTTLAIVTHGSWMDQELNQDEIRRTTIPQSVFGASRFNPFGQFLTKIRAEDLPVLDKITRHPKLQEFARPPTPTYGIKIGAAGRLKSGPTSGRLPLLKGQNVSTFHVDERHIAGWIDVDKVESKSIWGYPEVLGPGAIAGSEIAFAPQTAPFNSARFAFNNSMVIFVPDGEYAEVPWDLLLNSMVSRFVFGTTLRSGLICHGLDQTYGRYISRSHIYPRVLGEIPVAESFLQNPDPLNALARDLRELARAIRERWLAVEEALASAERRTLALSPVEFVNWDDETALEADPEVVQVGEEHRIQFYEDGEQKPPYVKGSYGLLNVVIHLLGLTEGPITRRILETLEVPVDPMHASSLIDNARDPESPEIRRLRDVLRQGDEAVMEAFDLTDGEKSYVRKRMETHPFDVLQPRWPWTPVKLREIQEYAEDRFA